ncbi:MAG: 50S ribosomal protein L9 [Phycisphaeraceae bacterium]|nr:50S ribosomal protein L9 [Phycisphaeraceae bacterium]
MAKSLKLLLIENVEALGIVGDVVNVRSGYARNFLLPRGLATQPSEERIKELAGKRAEAEKLLAEQRKHRVELNAKLSGVAVTLVRSCNDQGILYGAVTQQDIAASLKEQGFTVSPRDVRIPQTIKRVDSFDVHVKLDSDLDQIIKVIVKADRELVIEKPTHQEGEEPQAAGAGERPAPTGESRRRRDDWMIPDDSNRVVGWGAKKNDDGPGTDAKGGKGKGKSKPKAEKN